LTTREANCVSLFTIAVVHQWCRRFLRKPDCVVAVANDETSACLESGVDLSLMVADCSSTWAEDFEVDGFFFTVHLLHMIGETGGSLKVGSALRAGHRHLGSPSKLFTEEFAPILWAYRAVDTAALGGRGR